jgi:hypothetical protein
LWQAGGSDFAWLVRLKKYNRASGIYRHSPLDPHGLFILPNATSNCTDGTKFMLKLNQESTTQLKEDGIALVERILHGRK